VIDLHAHVLPGIDDGPDTLEVSLAMLREAAAEGTTALAATPHVRDDYPTSPEAMEQALAELRQAAAAAEISVELLPGAELDLEALRQLDDETLRRFGLGGNPRLLLLEFPYLGWPLGLEDTVFRLAARGFTAVLAHPERNGAVQADPERLRSVVATGAFVQITAASVDGRLGRHAQSAAATLLDLGLAHLLASDAHAPAVRRGGLAAAVDAIGDQDLGQWLVEDVPRALLAGAPPPPRPEPARRKRRLGRRR
jgi:protein-tyrosine phosphatase